MRARAVSTTEPLMARALSRAAASTPGGGLARHAASVYGCSPTIPTPGPPGLSGWLGGSGSTQAAFPSAGFALLGLGCTGGVRGMAGKAKMRENMKPLFTAEGRRVVDIGGMMAQAIAKMEDKRPVVAELGGTKMSPSVMHNLLQTLRALKKTRRVIEVGFRPTGGLLVPPP